MSLSGDLLAVARQLEIAPSSEASLRRSISTAYYAAFHALSDEIARPFKDDAAIAARRLLEHGSARDVANTLSTQQKVPWIRGQPSCHDSLLDFSDHFDQLWTARQQADYDLTYRPTSADATSALARAENACDDLSVARSRCPDQLDAVCVAILASKNTRGRLAKH